MRGMNGGFGLAVPAQRQPDVAIASPLNDVQLVALVAAAQPATTSPTEAVERAMRLVAEAVARAGDMGSMVRAAQALQPAGG